MSDLDFLKTRVEQMRADAISRRMHWRDSDGTDNAMSSWFNGKTAGADEVLYYIEAIQNA